MATRGSAGDLSGETAYGYDIAGVEATKPANKVNPSAPLSKSFTTTNPVLKYPSDLESANGHYMIFNVYARDPEERDLPATDLNVSNQTLGAYNDTFTSERFFDANTFGPQNNVTKSGVKLIKDTVVLYMPDDVTVNYKSNYEAAEVGSLVAGAAAASDFLKGNISGADFAKSLGLNAAKLIEPLVSFGTLGTAAGSLAALQRKTGLAPAPLQEMIFQGIDYRTFNYSFKMTPRNRKEAQDIKKIIDTFTFHMLPEKLGTGAALAFRIPSEFTIRYMYRGNDNGYLNTITYCALTDMKVSYGGGEKYVTYRPDGIGAPPVTTSVDLTFQELELIDRRRATKGTYTQNRPGDVGNLS
jgi:hypothetical protein